ncbi:MAG TPA: phasin family protein [Parvularculaceae bacterium]|nr:phasin family protein [Parvularculaceae bacterium]
MTAAKKTAARKPATNGAGTDTTAKSAANGAHDQFDAFLAAFTTGADAFRDQSQELLDQVRANFDAAQTRFKSANDEFVAAAREEAAEAVDYVNSLTRAGTVADALELHRDYWTARFEAGVDRAKALTEASVEAARETFEPFSKSFEPFSKSFGAFAPVDFGKFDFGKFMPFAQK